jgi:hypothetical protein
LQHGEELEPHVDERVILQEQQSDAFVRQDIVEIGHEWPVAVLLHHAPRAVDHVVEVLFRVVESVLRTNTHDVII